MEKALRIFGKLEDIRQPRKVQHRLIDIVILTLVGVMCGCTDWTEIAEFGKARKEQLKEYLELANGIPSHDTLRRVMGLVQPEQFAICYQEWVQSILPERSVDVISIDGKTVRGSKGGRQGFKPIHMVSAWSSQGGVTLGQVKTAEKSNEITAIPELLKMLNIAGCIITTDAIGCQTKITAQIREKQADYVVAVKENQESLYGEIKEYFEGAEKSRYLELPHYTAEREERNHGRMEYRSLVQIGECALLSRFHDFEGAQSIARLQSKTYREGKVLEETRYYLSSLPASETMAEQMVRAIRAHWGIENRCHWVLDVTLGEDACRTRDRIAAQNLTVARKIVLALAKRVPDEIVEKYSHNKAKWTSLKKRLFLAGLYPDFMVEILLCGL